jgi:hypothetical protein
MWITTSYLRPPSPNSLVALAALAALACLASPVTPSRLHSSCQGSLDDQIRFRFRLSSPCGDPFDNTVHRTPQHTYRRSAWLIALINSEHVPTRQEGPLWMETGPRPPSATFTRHTLKLAARPRSSRWHSIFGSSHDVTETKFVGMRCSRCSRDKACKRTKTQ